MTRPDVYFTWDIHYECNYNCTYCFLRYEKETSNIKTKYLSVDEWLVIWDGINRKYGRAHASVTGGEPFSYPGFIDLIASLTKMNSFEFSTNLFWDADEFSSKISKDAVRVNPSFHPEFSGMEEFLKKYAYLKSKGYNMGVTTLVAYPPFMEDMQKIKEEIEKAGIGVVVFPYRGPYGDKKYPGQYTEDEKKMLRSMGVGLASELNKGIAEKYDIGETQKVSNQNKLCLMGTRYGKILPNGDVFRCCAAVWTKEKTWENWGGLGNLFDGTFKLYEAPQVCKTPLSGDCVCYKAMIVGREENWKKHWKGM